MVYLFGLCALLSLHPAVSSGVALCAGVAFSLLFGNPAVARTRKWTPYLLQVSVVGLGASMNLMTVAAVGARGILYTALGIGFTFGLGFGLQKLFRTDRVVALLLAAGTAICGGSAIAAVSPVVGAKDHEVSVSLAIVFILNAAALFLFPWIGQGFDLSQAQFGLWSAVAIHDTSSVVGAGLQYGPEALTIGTTVKLARALWIVPMTFVIGWAWNRSQVAEKSAAGGKKPWFILGFLLMAAVVTWIPGLSLAGEGIAAVARRALVLTLFLIGSGLTRETLKRVGVRPLVHGVVLWLVVGSLSFFAVWRDLIRV